MKLDVFIVDCEVGYHSIAESILRFFGALPDSLIPSIYYEKCLQASKTSDATFKVCTNFRFFFIYVIIIFSY